jgi:protein tyrosine/serine phosphatase
MNLSVLAALLACSLLIPAFAGPRKKGDALVNIENFGQVNDHIYRGGQPKGDNYRQLATLGVKTIIDLRGDSEPGEKASAEAAALRYINLPLAPKHYPQADAAQRFLELVNDPANGVVYVHCAGGRHRTGAMVAVYRMSVDGWDIDRAYQEMKDYDFYTSMGHGCYKDYVYDYYRDWQAHHQRQPAVNAATAVTN